MLCHPFDHHHIHNHHDRDHYYHSRFEKEGVICGKQLGKVLRHIGQNPSEAEVTLVILVPLNFVTLVMVVKMVFIAKHILTIKMGLW